MKKENPNKLFPLNKNWFYVKWSRNSALKSFSTHKEKSQFQDFSFDQSETITQFLIQIRPPKTDSFWTQVMSRPSKNKSRWWRGTFFIFYFILFYFILFSFIFFSSQLFWCLYWIFWLEGTPKIKKISPFFVRQYTKPCIKNLEFTKHLTLVLLYFRWQMPSCLSSNETNVTKTIMKSKLSFFELLHSPK